MKIYAHSSEYFIRIVDDIDDEIIREFLQNKNSYIAAIQPFIDIKGPENEYYDVVDFLSSNRIYFQTY